MLKIVRADTPKHLPTVREIFREYADSLGFDLCFQEFEKELASLPGDYAPPPGRLYLAMEGTHAAGCIGLRKISPDTCEMKRLYVRPLYRGKGIGRDLARAVIGEARKIGYRRMVLDTLPPMKRAIALYYTLGFKLTASYRENPAEGATYMELKLV